MMKKVFVYGTLMQGFHNHGVLQGNSRMVGRGMVKGAIYHLPVGYPALIDGEGMVSGEIYEFEDGKVMGALDSLEGYRGQGRHNLYRREQRDVSFPDGSGCRCWVYIYEDTEAVERNGYPLGHGDWRRYQQERGE